MAEWSVHVEAQSGDNFGEPDAESLIETLASYAPAVSYAQGVMTARFNIEAGSAREAVDKALEVLGKSCPTLEVFRVDAQTIEGLEQELGRGPVPDLIGVAELAGLLGVSKQRASELAHRAGFPAPLAVLAAGPIWPLADVLRYVRSWKRRPGRPRNVARPTRGPATVRAKKREVH